MIYNPEFEIIQQKVILDDYSPSYKLGEFQCNDPDYTVWLNSDAKFYIEQNLSQVKLLLDRENDNIIGYIALCADCIELSISEKKRDGLRILNMLTKKKIPRSIPALKIGKLAINSQYEKQNYGSYLLWLSLAIAQEMNSIGVACRYLSLDADVSIFPTNDKFYESRGFKYNKNVNKIRQDELEKKEPGKKIDNISMRYDIFNI